MHAFLVHFVSSNVLASATSLNNISKIPTGRARYFSFFLSLYWFPSLFLSVSAVWPNSYVAQWLFVFILHVIKRTVWYACFIHNHAVDTHTPTQTHTHHRRYSLHTLFTCANITLWAYFSLRVRLCNSNAMWHCPFSPLLHRPILSNMTCRESTEVERETVCTQK